MHYVSSVYSVTISLHVSGLLVAHHQEVTVYMCNKWYVLYVLVDCQLAWLGSIEMHEQQNMNKTHNDSSGRLVYCFAIIICAAREPADDSRCVSMSEWVGGIA
jgi:hypothetical protein